MTNLPMIKTRLFALEASAARITGWIVSNCGRFVAVITSTVSLTYIVYIFPMSPVSAKVAAGVF
jgi:hypothetical protein